MSKSFTLWSRDFDRISLRQNEHEHVEVALIGHIKTKSLLKMLRNYNWYYLQKGSFSRIPPQVLGCEIYCKLSETNLLSPCDPSSVIGVFSIIKLTCTPFSRNVNVKHFTICVFIKWIHGIYWYLFHKGYINQIHISR